MNDTNERLLENDNSISDMLSKKATELSLEMFKYPKNNTSISNACIMDWVSLTNILSVCENIGLHVQGDTSTARCISVYCVWSEEVSGVTCIAVADDSLEFNNFIPLSTENIDTSERAVVLTAIRNDMSILRLSELDPAYFVDSWIVQSRQQLIYLSETALSRIEFLKRSK